MNAMLEGEVALTTTHTMPVLAGPFELPLKWPLEFTDGNTRVKGDAFPELLVKDDPRIVVTRVGDGSGTFDPGTGALRMPIRLRVRYPLGFATIELELTTEMPGGRRVTADTGAVTLVASGPFHDPLVLNGVDCSLTVTGHIDPNPRS